MPESVRRIGLALAGGLPVRAALAHVRAAEESGFETLWMHETYFQRDAISYLAAMACAVERMRLAPGCVGPYTRHPVLLAMTMATLSETCNGRALLGLGVGNPKRLVDVGFSRQELAAEGVGEAMDICRALWAGERVEYRGRRFQVSGVRLEMPTPAAPVPIYVAGWSRRMLQLCGERGDGYLGSPGEPVSRLLSLVSAIRAAASASGRDPRAVDIAANILCSADEDAGRAKEAARRDPFVLFLLTYILPEPFDPEWRARLADVLPREGPAAAARLVSDEQLAIVTACGTPRQVADRLDAYAGAGVDQPVIQPLRTGREAVEPCLAAGRLWAGGRG